MSTFCCPHCGAVSDQTAGDSPASFTVHGIAMPMDKALQTLYSGNDPALAKIDYEARNATTQPATSRQELAAVRARAIAQRSQPVTPKAKD